MRQLLVQVPQGQAERVLAQAREAEAVNVALLDGRGREGEPVHLVLLHVANARAGPLLDALEAVPDLHVSFLPTGALALRPPPDAAAGQVEDVSPLSPLEVFLAVLQGVGSWKGFLVYAVCSGVVG